MLAILIFATPHPTSKSVPFLSCFTSGDSLPSTVQRKVDGRKRARAALRNRYVRTEQGLQGYGGQSRGGVQEGVQPGRRCRQSIRSRSPVWHSTMADKNKVAEQYYAPPPVLGAWESFRIFLWNSETGQVLGRTGSSWGKYSNIPFLLGTKDYRFWREKSMKMI